MRTFEVPACGTLLICDSRGALKNLFDDGDEILTFKTKEELSDAVRFALTSERASTIARKGMQRVLAEHTYAHRANTILSLAREM